MFISSPESLGSGLGKKIFFMSRTITQPIYWPVFPQIAELERGGKLFIPEMIRKYLKIQGKKKFVIFPVGESILATPWNKKMLELEEDQRIKEIMKKKNMTLETLFEDSEKEGRKLYKELYD